MRNDLYAAAIRPRYLFYKALITNFRSCLMAALRLTIGQFISKKVATNLLAIVAV